jgi:hypothetical protein
MDFSPFKIDSTSVKSVSFSFSSEVREASSYVAEAFLNA